MAQKYHIGKNGPAPCRATKRACKFGGDGQHYSSLDDAQKAYEKKLSDKTQTISRQWTEEDINRYIETKQQEEESLADDIHELTQDIKKHQQEVNEPFSQHYSNVPEIQQKIFQLTKLKDKLYNVRNDLYVLPDFMRKFPDKTHIRTSRDFSYMSGISAVTNYTSHIRVDENGEPTNVYIFNDKNNEWRRVTRKELNNSALSSRLQCYIDDHDTTGSPWKTPEKEEKDKKPMTAEEIKAQIQALAKNQGFYSKLVGQLTDEHYHMLAQEGFKDPVDLVLFFET